MVDARRQDDQITLLQPDSDPIVALAPDIKETCAIENVSDFFVLVQVLMEKALHLLFVDVAHLLRRYGDFISVLVAALLCKCVDIVVRADMLIDYAKVGEIAWVDTAPRVVREALVALGG